VDGPGGGGPPETLPVPVVTPDVSVCGQVTVTWTNVPTTPSGFVATSWHIMLFVWDGDEWIQVTQNNNYTTTSFQMSLDPGLYQFRVRPEGSSGNTNYNGGFVEEEFTVESCSVNACSPGFFMNHPSTYTDALFESVFNTGVVSNTWMLSDALDNPGNPPSAPQPNPYNANFVGTGAYLSSLLVVGYPYSTAFVVDAVQDAHNGDPTALNVLAAVFSNPHVCPLE
jgi:hypothetical protein